MPFDDSAPMSDREVDLEFKRNQAAQLRAIGKVLTSILTAVWLGVGLLAALLWRLW